VPNALRAAGWQHRTHFEVFGHRDQAVTDVEWLERCGSESWIVLTKDRRIRYRPAEIAAVRRFAVKAFVLTVGNLTAAEQARRFNENRSRIEQACREDGPFLYAVHARRIQRLFP
jgi:PIN like domain